MKIKRYYPLICLFCIILSLFCLCASDISRKKIAKGETKRREALEELISEKNREIGRSLSEIYWSGDNERYLESREKISVFCGEIRGAMKMVAPEEKLYLRYIDLLESFISSLPESPTPEIRERCGQLRKLNRDLIKAQNRPDRKDDIEEALLALIERVGKETYRDRMSEQSSDALPAIMSAPTERSSA